ncbi:MAG: hypothetical protein LUG14_04995 [Synergistaceae bacterium]|nr:hypothetical protein [Synergistaceae bacterium]
MGALVYLGIVFFFPLCYITASIIISIIIGRKKKTRWGWLTLAVLLSLPFTDQLIVECLFTYYRYTQTPYEQIKRTVEYPESVFFKYNISNRFNTTTMCEIYAKLFLDGEHLKKLAIKKNDGLILLYTQLNRYAGISKKIGIFIPENIASPDIYHSESVLPKMNYEVEFKLLPIGWFAKLFIHADIVRITDNNTNEVIAYSKRFISYTTFLYRMIPDISGMRGKYHGGKFIGGQHNGFNLPWKVLFEHVYPRKFNNDEI